MTPPRPGPRVHPAARHDQRRRFAGTPTRSRAAARAPRPSDRAALPAAVSETTRNLTPTEPATPSAAYDAVTMQGDLRAPQT